MQSHDKAEESVFWGVDFWSQYDSLVYLVKTVRRTGQQAVTLQCGQPCDRAIIDTTVTGHSPRGTIQAESEVNCALLTYAAQNPGANMWQR